MNTLNLSTTQTNYPLTIEGVKLLQDAIALAASGVLTGASSDGCYIVSGCTESNKMIQPGTLLINGELFSITTALAKDYFVHVTTATEDVAVGSVTYSSARKIRTITFEQKSTDKEDANPKTFFAWANFIRIQNNVDLSKLINNNDIDYPSTSNYLVPKGAIIMWSGSPDNIPFGWALCDGWYYNPTNSADKMLNPPSTDTTHTLQSPNLQGRFVVGYWNKTDSTHDSIGNPGLTNYGAIGNIGGEITTTDIIGHTHSYFSDDSLQASADMPLIFMKTRYTNHSLNGGHSRAWLGDFVSNQGSYNLGFYATSHPMKMKVNPQNPDTDIEHTFQEKQELENRPPYYTLAYIMKIH